jgi:outer membrane immunogenic protein
MKRLLMGAAGAVLAGAQAFAADLPVKAPPVAPAIAYSFTGFYVGANGGYSWGRASTDLTETSITTTTATITTLGGTPIASATVVGPPVQFVGSDKARVDGWLGGLQAGYNYQFDRWVWGIEGDLQITSERGGVGFCFAPQLFCQPGTVALGAANYSFPWFGTLRGRVGVVAFDRVLFYGTGGLAVGQIKGDYVDAIAAGLLTPAAAVTTSVSQTRVGWVAGAGIEGALWGNWTLKIEYLHMDLGSIAASATGLTAGAFAANIGDFRTTLTQSTVFNSAFHTRFTDDLIRIGLNYRFGWAPAPVVTRY